MTHATQTQADRKELLEEAVELLEQLEMVGRKLGRNDPVGREILAQSQGRIHGEWLGTFLRDLVEDEIRDLDATEPTDEEEEDDVADTAD